MRIGWRAMLAGGLGAGPALAQTETQTGSPSRLAVRVNVRPE